MKKFNIKDYPGNVKMHCDTEEKAKVFCKYLDSVGNKWHSGKSYLEETYWNDEKENTCYAFNIGTYQSLDFFQRKRLHNPRI